MDTISDNNLGPLKAGQTVAIIGGGPAGSSCAIMLRRLASARGIPLRVIVFERKDFGVEQNICVGVLAPPFRRLLSSLDLVLPGDIIQRRIKGYTLHSKRRAVYLEGPSGNAEQTVAVNRSDLDAFLLRSVQEAGATVFYDTVVDIVAEPGGVQVITGEGARVPADALVGAFGLDTDTLSVFEARIPSFRRPGVTKSILTEIAVGEQTIDGRMDDTIHALLIDQLPGVEFGAVTPKREHVTVNIAGHDVTDVDLDAFLALSPVKKLVPEATLREPRHYTAFPSVPAQNFYDDRVVTIGNAAGLLRPLKGKGINTGIITGIEAARTMIEVGISKRAFDEFYRQCGHLTSEFRYGSFLRWLYGLSNKLDSLDAVLALAAREPLLHRAFYEMVSGEGSYREIIWRSARPGLVTKIITAVARQRILRRR